MDKTKTLKKIKALSDEIQKMGDEESVLAAYSLNFVALFLAVGHIDLLLAFFGNLGALIKRTEEKKVGSDPLVIPIAAADIIKPN